MDNQQVRLLDDIELSWVAGIIEGEGYVGLARKSKGDFQYIPRVAIINTDVQMLEEVGRILEDHHLAYYKIRHSVDKRVNRHMKRNREVHDIVFTGIGRVGRLLDAIIPYMRGEKKARALLVKQFCDFRATQYLGKRPLPYTEVEHDIYTQFRALVENPRDYTLDPFIRDDIVRPAAKSADAV